LVVDSISPSSAIQFDTASMTLSLLSGSRCKPSAKYVFNSAGMSQLKNEVLATHGFILANIIHEFEDETQVNVSGAQLVNSVDDWSGELGVGINHAWDQGTTHYELFAAVTGGTSLSNMGDSNSVQGEVGFKAHF
jgi:type V secretory pathway adhesin AidA